MVEGIDRNFASTKTANTKTMKKFILATALVLPLAVFGQAIPTNIRSQISLERLTTSSLDRVGNNIIGIPVPAGRVVGDFYLDPKWNLGSVEITNKNATIDGYPMKYDIKSQNVEILTPTGIRLLELKNVGAVVWFDSLTRQPHYFVNASKYTLDGAPMTGLMEVLADGKRALFSKAEVHVKQPTYVVAIDAGSRDTEIYKKVAYYYNNGTELVLIKSKKKFLEGFSAEERSDIESFMKKNSVDMKSERDLIALFSHLASKNNG